MNTSLSKRRNSGYTVTELMTFVVIVFILLAVVCAGGCKAFGGLNIKYSEGQRTGIVYKLSQKGFIWKTYEGELSLQLTTRNSEGGLVNQIFQFSVSDPKVAQELEAAAATGKPVTVHYRQYLVRGYKYGSTDYDVVRIVRDPSTAVEKR